jgi:hypothetical protein
MTWLLWRQHRTQALVTAVLLAAFTVAVVATGVHMAHQYDDALHGCTGSGSCDLVGNLFRGDGAIVDIVHMTVIVPAILGILGETLIARETEHATNVLVWTQTVTRRRWVFSKVALALGTAVVTGVALSALVTWWSRTPNSLYGNRFEGAQFDTQNVVPIAFAVFGVALGLAAGAWFRRTLPAIATTIVGFVTVRLVASVYLRPLYESPVTRSFPLGHDAPSGSYTIDTEIADRTGHVVSGAFKVPASCPASRARGPLESCLSRLGYRNVVKFQPPSHYWPAQWIEAGIFIALAAVLVTFAVVRTRRRDA